MKTSLYDPPPAAAGNPVSGVHTITSDAEALEIASRFAADIDRDANERHRASAHPHEHLKALAGSGLLGIRVPRRHGGALLSIETLCEVIARIAQSDASIAQMYQNHFVCMTVFVQGGTEAQKAFFYDRLLRHGDRFGNATSERGTKTSGIYGTRIARQPDGDYVIHGTKYYSTGSLSAQWPTVHALDADGRQHAAFVPRNSPGLEVVNDWSAMGQRGTASGTAHFNQVKVSPDLVIEHWRTLDRPQTGRPLARVMHAAIDVGLARRSLAEVVAHLASQDGGAAAHNAALQERVGRYGARLAVAEALLRRASRVIDRPEGEPLSLEAANGIAIPTGEVEAYAGDLAVEVAGELFAILGERADTLALGLDRFWRDARTHTLHDPSTWSHHRAGLTVLHGRAPDRAYDGGLTYQSPEGVSP